MPAICRTPSPGYLQAKKSHVLRRQSLTAGHLRPQDETLAPSPHPLNMLSRATFPAWAQLCEKASIGARELGSPRRRRSPSVGSPFDESHHSRTYLNLHGARV